MTGRSPGHLPRAVAAQIAETTAIHDEERTARSSNRFPDRSYPDARGDMSYPAWGTDLPIPHLQPVTHSHQTSHRLQVLQPHGAVLAGEAQRLAAALLLREPGDL